MYYSRVSKSLTLDFGSQATGQIEYTNAQFVFLVWLFFMQNLTIIMGISILYKVLKSTVDTKLEKFSLFRKALPTQTEIPMHAYFVWRAFFL